MTRQNWLLGSVFVAVLLVAGPSSAQFASASPRNVTTADIQRLQDQVYQASSEVSRLGSRNGDLASRLPADLDDLSDEVIYLKVRLRKEGGVPEREYLDVRDRLQDLRSRARGEVPPRPGPMTNNDRGTWSSGNDRGNVGGGVYDDRAGSRNTTRQGSSSIPVGTELDVRLQNELSSATAQVEQRFEATTVADLYRGNDVIIPAGSVMRGVVSSVDKATRTDRKGSMTVAFDQVTIDGRSYPIRATVTQAIESEGMRGEVGKIGAGSAVGAIIGGILGGAKGALLGVLIGGGGTIAATEGKDVTLPPGTILRVRLDQPPAIR